MILKNLNNLEKQINKNLNYTEKLILYSFIEKYENEIKIIYDEYRLNLNILDKYFKNEEKILNNFDITYNDFIRNKKEYIGLILSIFLIKAFLDEKTINCNDLEIFNYKNISFESDNIINTILEDYKSFNIWLEIFSNENKIIKEEFFLEKKKIRSGIFKLILILSQKKIINIKKKWIGLKSLNFYLIIFKKKNFIFIEIFKEKFKIYENSKNIYIYINHYSNVFQILKENLFSGSRLNISSKSKFFENILNSSAYIDYELLEYYFDKKIKKENYEKEKLNEYYVILTEEIKKCIEDNNIENLSIFSKKLSEILNILRIHEILKNKDNRLFYFPILLCFRGRTYFTSSISFTFFKEIRYCLHQGEYKKNEEVNFHYLNKEINEILEKFIWKIDLIKKFNLKKISLEDKRSVLWLLISISEIFKKKIGCVISIENFLDYGIKILNKEIQIDECDEFDDLKIKAIEKTLNELEMDIHIKRLISKDATASVFQHLIKILGNRDEESLKWCNLKNKENWYDTYEYILNNWKKTIKIEDDEKELIEKHFNRKSIKKPTMTFQYGAKFQTCWKYFIDDKNLNENEIKKLKFFFKKYFLYMNENLGILKNSPEKIIDELEKSKFLVKFDDKTEIDLNYYKTKKGQIKIKLNEKISSKSEIIISNKIDKKKIKTSSRANYVHAHDSAIIRYLISIKPFLTIHDCILIDPKNITFLIALVNEAMRKSFHDLKINKNFNINEIFSIFILI